MKAKKANLPPRSNDVAKITKSPDLNKAASTNRGEIEKFIKKAFEPMRSKDIAFRTGIDANIVRRTMSRLYAEGKVVNLGTEKCALWQLAGAAKKVDYQSYHRSGTMPNAKPGDLPRMECAR